MRFTLPIRHVARCVACLVLFAFTSMAAPAFAQTDLSGTYRIQEAAGLNFLHEDGWGSQLLNTIWQPNDDFTRFVLERQSDGSYRIRVKASGRYLHADGLGDQLISTRIDIDDDYTRFFFDPRPNGAYRIRVKATGRYWTANVPGDQLVSTLFDLDPGSGFGNFRLFREGSPTCDSSGTAVCLNEGRFRASFRFSRPDGSVLDARVAPSRTDDSGLFYFVNDQNWEMLIKVLDGCGLNGHYWVFYAATTTLGFTLTVEDTQSGAVRQWSNPPETSAVPITDTLAFATCP